ncbi:MAG: sugar nucleotide-binding protein [Cyanobacteria bacterium LVE1205-1]|jgi:dTDP-4-dehydrorhamnose reductase
MAPQLSPRSLLIVGSSGTIGRSLAAWFTGQNHPVWLTTRDATAIDPQTRWLNLAQPVFTWPLDYLPCRVAVLCAAVTSHKACEENYAASYAINVSATVELAKRLIEAGSFVVFLSTNLVFDGTIPRVPAEHPVNPQTAYGQQKAEAEQTLLDMAPDCVAIVRLTKVLDRGFPLVQGWIDALGAGQPIHPFTDLYLAPISLEFATAVVAQVTQKRLSGIIQASAHDDLSYAELAYRLAEKLCLDTNLIQPVSCQNTGVTYAPRHTTLDTDRLQSLGMDAPEVGQVIDQLWDPNL